MAIDRLEPTRRPNRRAIGFQEWRRLVFLHWPVPIDMLRPLVPSSLELDLHEGLAYVGIVPFAMQHVRPWWCPRPLGFNFLETNVRTYVCYQDRPGVYFFSLEAASRLAVWVARRFWGLPYFHARMETRRVGDEIQYRSTRHGMPARHQVRCRIGASLGPSPLGTIEFFFLERYLLFVERKETLYVGQVHHVPYPVHTAEVLEVEDHLASAVGIGCCDGRPAFAHYSPGVDVEIFPLEPADRRSTTPSTEHGEQP